MTASVTSAGSTSTFVELLQGHGHLQIPIIQRDYVQGRDSQGEVRTAFLKSLLTALTREINDDASALDLDFVYGSVANTATHPFQPLDGQQRLTTLFLLHWYLACAANRHSDFAVLVSDNRKSRFSYAIRPSSEEFFNELVRWRPEKPMAAIPGLSAEVEDQPWYFRSWKLDPTIHACLDMLDAIHALFRVAATATDLYARLTDTARPRITFQLLNLKDFGLSDDLYIKMNARGKALTAFETFKAQLSQHLDIILPDELYDLRGAKISAKNYFSHQADTVWAHIFWHYCESKSDRPHEKRTIYFDTYWMNFIRAVVMITRDPSNSASERIIENLLENKQRYSFVRYRDEGCLDQRFARVLIALLDKLSNGGKGISTHLGPHSRFNEVDLFKRLIEQHKKLEYVELLQFHAWCSYLVTHPCTEDDLSLSNWMRVIQNLSNYSAYDNVSLYFQSVVAIDTVLITKAQDILPYMASYAGDLKGFLGQQIREERIKAALLLRSTEWAALIERAESHGYFNGQIDFLLNFSGVVDEWLQSEAVSWCDAIDVVLLASFANFLDRACRIFDSDGLRDFGECRWERALLSVGDYLLYGKSNYCFLYNTHRDLSWKRLLRGSNRESDGIEHRRTMVKQLLLRLDPDDVPRSLDQVVDEFRSRHSPQPDDEWRHLLVTNPALIRYCQDSMIRMISDTKFYLFKGERISGEHAELFTYDLLTRLLTPAHEAGALAPFADPGYTYSNSQAQEPHVYMDASLFGRTQRIMILNDGDRYRLTLLNVSEQHDAPLWNRLLAANWDVELGLHLVARVARSEVLPFLQRTAQVWQEIG